MVGVVGDVPQEAAQKAPDPEAFTYYENTYWPYSNFVIRSTAPPGVLAQLIRQEVSRLDGLALVESVAAMSDRLGEARSQPRIRSLLVGAFALIALVLAALGVYGLIAGDLAGRWREFGVRLALGATIGSLRRIMLRKVARLLAAGALLGAAGVFSAMRLIGSRIEGFGQVSFTTALVVIVAVSLAALVALIWPMRRIARIDPAAALRHE